MKIKTVNVLWTLLALVVLPGCTTVKNNNLYSMWEERAYSAYGMPVPAASVNPFSAAMLYRPAPNSPLESVSAALLNVSRTVSEQDAKFISQYYSLQ
ncbi:MAG: hypothetical protein L3K52_04830 [Candidatus Thiothrix sulfatifontis]|nr:MAG: hypothetical protein L3K52_04830 [Candidatus Thiothrix sulfatifontis]